MTFSDYIIYVDESGDHSLTSIDTGYPIFVLSFCIFKKSEYVNSVVPRIQHFKFRWFGHDLVILHEHEIVKKQPPFGFFQFDDIRSRFMTELTEIINASPMTVIAAVIRKTPFETSNVAAGNPYAVALLSCLERTRLFLQTQSAKAGTVHIVCEARSARKKGGKMGREDEELEQEFRRIVAGRHGLQSRTGSEAMPEFEIFLRRNKQIHPDCNWQT